MKNVISAVCVECGAEYEATPNTTVCPKCGGKHFDKEKPMTKTLARKDFLFCEPPEVILQSKK